MKKHHLLPLLSIAALSVFAQETIPPLLVQDSPLSISQSGGLDTSLAAYLRYEPGVQVIPQGIAGGSSDLSIRGSAFSGAGLSFGGVALRNPQTEHFHSDFPFPAWWLAAPEVRTGTRQAACGEGHLAGTVALTPLPMRARRVVSGGVDSEGGFSLTGGLQYVQETLHGNTFGLGAFAGFMDAPNVDSLGNDVESVRVGAQMQHLSPFGQTDVWLGYQEKTFGTTGYYGVSPEFQSEETTEDTLILGTFRTFDSEAPLELSVMVREFKDDYRLDLPTGLFRNEHTTNTRAVEAGYRHPVNEFFGVTGRASFDTEEIQSSNLGNFDRSRGTLTLLPDFLAADNLRLFAGARAEFLEDFDNEFLPLARAEFTPGETLMFYVDYSESARRPSYTELNYESPGSLGNAGLDVQTQRSLEVGAQWQPAPHTFTSITLFRHETKDTVDWIRSDAAAPRWQAENIGTVTTLGAELLLRQRVTQDLDITGTLTLLDKDADNEPFASRYALDYARQIAGLQLDWQIQDGLRLEANQSVRNQVDNNLRTRGGDTQFLTSLALHARPETIPQLQVSLTASNLLDDDFRDFAGQDTYAERRFAASVSYDW
ncbi:MAG: TonB-dependent receptor [Verrucomicrobia bacterium]|nr:TonB-dependent receptor [Verrucomicrobiota bacterium]MCH8527516.1 TonB-dependent receptor [Kiritimatiellia bacterium]